MFNNKSKYRLIVIVDILVFLLIFFITIKITLSVGAGSGSKSNEPYYVDPFILFPQMKVEAPVISNEFGTGVQYSLPGIEDPDKVISAINILHKKHNWKVKETLYYDDNIQTSHVRGWHKEFHEFLEERNQWGGNWENDKGGIVLYFINEYKKPLNVLNPSDLTVTIFYHNKDQVEKRLKEEEGQLD